MTTSMRLGSTWAGLGVLVLALLSVVAIAVGMLLAEDGVRAFLLGLALASLLIMLIPVLFKVDYYLFEPHSFVLVSVLMGVFFKTFYLVIYYNQSNIIENRLLLGLSHDVLQYGSFVLLLGITFYVLGYLLSGVGKSRGNKQFLRGFRFSYRRSIVLSVLVLVVGVFFFILHVRAVGGVVSTFSDLSQKRFLGDGLPGERFSQLSYIYYKLALISKAPMYLMFYLVYRYRMRWFSLPGLVFFLALLLNIFAPFFISNKTGILLPILDLIVITYIISGRMNWRKVALPLVAAIVIMGIMVGIRGGDTVSTFSIADSIFGNRYFVEVTKTAHIVNGVPHVVDYFYGKSFVAWLNVVLPQSMEFEGRYFADMGFFLGRYIFLQASSGVTPGIVAECYLNFGLIGVVIGMLLVGLVLGRVHKILAHSMDNAVIIIAYAMFVVRAPTMLFNGSLGTAVLKCGLDIITVVVLLMLVRTRKGQYV